MSDLSHHLKKETSFSKKEVFYVCIEEIKLIFTATIKCLSNVLLTKIK